MAPQIIRRYQRTMAVWSRTCEGCGQSTQVRSSISQPPPPRCLKCTRNHGPRRPLLDSFAERVNHTNDGCWQWIGTIDSAGYGVMSAGPKGERAHRLAWKLFRGEPDKGKVIDHICRHKWCANPFHLRLVTPRINTLENNDCASAKNAKKTHCKHGHPFDERNTYIRKDGGGRMCRRCHVIAQTALNRIKRARRRPS